MITEQDGTHVAILVAVGMMVVVVVSFRFAAYGALAIAASLECGLNDDKIVGSAGYTT